MHPIIFYVISVINGGYLALTREDNKHKTIGFRSPKNVLKPAPGKTSVFQLGAEYKQTLLGFWSVVFPLKTAIYIYSGCMRRINWGDNKHKIQGSAPPKTY